jgi:hypothetical protein
MNPEPRLAEFLAHLATDSERMALFASSPAEARRLMDEAGLSGEEQRAFSTHNVDAVAAELSRHSAEVLAIDIPVMPGPGKPKKKRPAKKRRPAKRPPTKRAPAKRAPAKRAPAKRAPAKRGPAKRGPAKRGPAKRSPAKRGAAKRRAKP